MCRRGGMVDALDSKSSSKRVWVRVPPSVPTFLYRKLLFISTCALFSWNCKTDCKTLKRVLKALSYIGVRIFNGLKIEPVKKKPSPAWTGEGWQVFPIGKRFRRGRRGGCICGWFPCAGDGSCHPVQRSPGEQTHHYPAESRSGTPQGFLRQRVCFPHGGHETHAGGKHMWKTVHWFSWPLDTTRVCQGYEERSEKWRP